MVLLMIGGLSLLGGPHRWARRPWLVGLQGLLAIAVSMTNTFLIVIAHAQARVTDFRDLAFVALTAAIAGAGIDEALASAQSVRRHFDHGRRFWRSLLGLKANRRSDFV